MKGVLYENICVQCNPGAVKKGELEQVKEGAPSLYVGETSRSIQERAREHWGALRRGDEDSHMRRHQLLAHGDDPTPPNFMFKIVCHPRTALSRQVRGDVQKKNQYI